MRVVSENDEVVVAYEGKLATGEIFDSAGASDPLKFRIGDGAVLPAFEQALLGMRPNDSKTITVPADEAFGQKNEELIMAFSLRAFAGKELTPGMILGMDLEKDGQSHQVPAMVLAVDPETATVDFNHPLAGQDLTYRITVLSIAPPAPGGCCGS